MPILFISRGTMAGASKIADCLQERTGIRCISHETLTKRVDRHGDLATQIMEKLDGAISAYEQFSKLRWSYLVLLRHALLEEVLADNMVYHGYSAHFLLPPLQHFIRTRIDAPLEFRVKMTMERRLCDEQAARDYITKADEERVRWARLMYHRDIRDPRFYDLHLNLGHISFKAVCGLFERVMSEDEFQTLPESRSKVSGLLLAASVEANLVSDTRTNPYEISAKAEDGTVHLFGPYLAASDLEIVREISAATPGVQEVAYTPGYAPSLDLVQQMP